MILIDWLESLLKSFSSFFPVFLSLFRKTRSIVNEPIEWERVTLCQLVTGFYPILCDREANYFLIFLFASSWSACVHSCSSESGTNLVCQTKDTVYILYIVCLLDVCMCEQSLKSDRACLFVRIADMRTKKHLPVPVSNRHQAQRRKIWMMMMMEVLCCYCISSFVQ